MASPLTWIFQLIDKVSSPASKMAHAMASVEKGMGGLGAAAAHVERGLAEAGHKVKEFGLEVLELEAAIEIAERGFEILKRFGEGYLEIGKMGVEAAAFKENTLLAFETILGTKRAAAEVFEETERIAKGTAFDPKEMLRLRRELITGGFNAGDSALLLRALADVGTLKGMDPSAMERFAGDLIRLQTTGKVTGRELTMLAGAGIKADDVFGILGTKAGKTADQMRKLAEEGKLDSTSFIHAMLLALQHSEGGAIGTASGRGAETITGLLTRVRSLPDLLFSGLEGSGAMSHFKGFLHNIVEVLDPAKTFGRGVQSKIVGVFDNAFGALFGNFSGAGGAAKLERLFGGLVDVAGAFTGGLFSGLGGTLGELVDQLGSTDPLVMQKLADGARDFGHAIAGAVDGIGKLAGLIGSVLGPAVEGLGMIHDLITGNEAALNRIGSKAGANLGDNVYDVSQNMTAADAAKAAFVSFFNPAAGAAVVVNSTVHVNAPGATSDDANHIASVVQRKQKDELTSALEKQAIQRGAQ